MARLCTICHHPRLPEVAVDVANGLADGMIAERYGFSRSAVQRHRQHSGAPSPAAIAERKSAAFQALASLPSAAEVGTAYSSIGARIDAIAAKAEQEGSLAVALMGLRELRSHGDGAGPARWPRRIWRPSAGQHPGQRRPWRGRA